MTSRRTFGYLGPLLFLAPGTDAILAQTVEIHINQRVDDPDSAVTNEDDYLTWAPTFCRARLVGGDGDATIVLSNGRPSRLIFIDSFVEAGDRFEVLAAGESVSVTAGSSSRGELADAIAVALNADSSPPFMNIEAMAVDDTVVLQTDDHATLQGLQLRTVEGDGSEADHQVFELAETGAVNFRQFEEPWPEGTTADRGRLELSLPGDSSWRPFVIAGRPGSPSSNGKDVVVEARLGHPDGEVVGQKRVMVRVRRDLLSLTYRERLRLMDAIAAIHFEDPTYRGFVERHTLGTPFRYPMPNSDELNQDQAHDGPGFLPWHRAFLLRMERRLQQEDPRVALHYWREEGPGDEIFSGEFLGANPSTSTPTVSNVTFSSRDPSRSHPLEGWNYGGAPLSRASVPRDRVSFSIRPESRLVTASDFLTDDIFTRRSLSVELENNPHNLGHGWVGSWMASCKTSPRDPIFWLFHSDIDRLWARWQHVGDHFGTDGSDPSDYAPTGTRPPQGEFTLGHYLEDTMWPWDGVHGRLDPADERDNRPPSAPGGPFPAAPFRGLWPPADEPHVRPADMIDYLGHGAYSRILGFCYDDSPYGVTRPEPLLVARPDEAEQERLDALLDHEGRFGARLRAARELDAGGLTREQTGPIRSLLLDAREPDQLRVAALRLLEGSASVELRDDAEQVLRTTEEASDELLVESMRVLWSETMFSNEGMRHVQETTRAIRPFLQHPSPTVRGKAFELLAPIGDERALAAAREALAAPRSPLLPVETAVEILSTSPSEENFSAVRPLLLHEDADVREAAVRMLAADPDSREAVIEILRDQGQPLAVRGAALSSGLASESPELLDVALQLAADVQMAPALRVRALNAVSSHAKRFSRALGPSRLGQIEQQVERIPAGDDELLQASKANALRDIRSASGRPEPEDQPPGAIR